MSSLLIAVGGNSLIRAGEKGTIDQQLANTRRTAAAIVALLRDGHRLVVTHGNGPQVGAALLRSERAADQVYGQSLDVCDATTQGEIGYLLQQSLHNELAAAGLRVPVATILTQVVVNADDPAMRHPTKPIGPFYSHADAQEIAPGVVVDFDSAGKIVGIDIDQAAKIVDFARNGADGIINAICFNCMVGNASAAITEKIRTAPEVKFDTSIEGLKALKAAKVSDAVIKQMIIEPQPRPGPWGAGSGVPPPGGPWGRS